MPPVSNIVFEQPRINDPVIDFKTVMAKSIDRWLEEDVSRTKKALAIDLGATQADLSHWLTSKTSFTLPGHLVPAFCRIVGDNSLIWHITASYEKAPGSDTRGSTATAI